LWWILVWWGVAGVWAAAGIARANAARVSAQVFRCIGFGLRKFGN